MARTPGGGGPQITIPLDRLPEILDRLITEREARARLERDPVEALGALGVEFDDDTRERFAGRSLTELVAEEVGMEPRTLQQLGIVPAVLVAVATRGTRPVTSSRSRTAVTSGVKTVTATGTTVVTTTAVNTVISREVAEPPARPTRPTRRTTAGRGRRRGR
jgi:hypothetical protein